MSLMRTADSTTVDSTSGWKSSLGKNYKQNSARPRTSTLNSGRATAQRRQTLSTLPAFSCCFHCSIISAPTIAIHSLPHYYWHISQIIITLEGELLLSECNCILVISYPLSPPFPFDHNYTCRRVKWSEHGMGPMQHWLTTATPFKSQQILFKARALGSNF